MSSSHIPVPSDPVQILMLLTFVAAVSTAHKWCTVSYLQHGSKIPRIGEQLDGEILLHSLTALMHVVPDNPRQNSCITNTHLTREVHAFLHNMLGTSLPVADLGERSIGKQKKMFQINNTKENPFTAYLTRLDKDKD